MKTLTDEEMAMILTICRLCGHQVGPANVEAQYKLAWDLIEQSKLIKKK